MIIASRLSVPATTRALLWDLDGVLLDTLSYDYEVCNELLAKRYGPAVTVDRATIRRLFPLDLPAFWEGILSETLGAHTHAHLRADADAIAEQHERLRREAHFQVNPGIREIVTEARQRGLKQAVVSNNPTEQVNALLRHPGLLELFNEVIGNDIESIAKKPAPDPYLLAARRLGVAPALCAVIEDSLLGLTSGQAAGCHTIGVATGASSVDDLVASGLAANVFPAFEPIELTLSPGNVAHKRIQSPNEFVSHMVEHIAWRLGCAIQMNWNNHDWYELGTVLGDAIARFPASRDAAAMLGMIDDGSAEVYLRRAAAGRATFRAIGSAEVAWFLGLRCEQISNGTPMQRLLDGLAEALRMEIDVTICAVEDPHHTWEGIFRSVGIALSRMVALPPPAEPPASSPLPAQSGWFVEQSSLDAACVSRRTAESIVRVQVDWTGYAPPACRFDVAPSISVTGLGQLLDIFCHAAGCRLDVEFIATRLNSSHVVMEDTGMVLGRAIREMFEQRMARTGANGAGSSLADPAELDQAIHVGVSIEGRKFWKYVPFAESYESFRRNFLIGHLVGEGLFSEDLDDFIDGLSGGMGCSVMVHVRRPIGAAEGWPLVFRGLGLALAMALTANPYRRGVTPGVKATLA